MSEIDSDESPSRIKRRGMRTGYTTGACATAAAKAATWALIHQRQIYEVTIHLPVGQDATLTLHSCQLEPDGCLCSVIKDAGDDPDVTHGAEIRAEVRWAGEPGIHLCGGEGVGIVTLPGLGLEVGGAAINPVPRQMILGAVGEVAAGIPEGRGLTVEISVPGGAELAKKTLNPRLGIVGGISILGTSGIVKPYSTASWRASVEQAVDVAAANEQSHLVLATGSRSEKFAMKHVPLPEIAFVEMGIFTGKALRRCVQKGIRKASLAGMVGKFAKLALGHFQTHVAGNQVDPAFLAELARGCGATQELVGEIRKANTARHVQELIQRAGLDCFFQALCEQVAERSWQYVNGKLEVEAILFDFDGTVLGRAERHG